MVSETNLKYQTMVLQLGLTHKTTTLDISTLVYLVSKYHALVLQSDFKKDHAMVYTFNLHMCVIEIYTQVQ